MESSPRCVNRGIMAAMSAPIPTLEYATSTPLLDPNARRAFWELLLLSILSGLCVGVCFLVFTGSWLAVFLHVAIFIATITLAVRAGMSVVRLSALESGGHRIRLVLDSLAGLGLVGIAMAPIVYYTMENTYSSELETMGTAALGVCYALLAATTYRHVLLYRFLAEVCNTANHPTIATRLVRLGWGKAIYETLWLACCAMSLLLISAGNAVPGSRLTFQDAAMWCAFAGLFGAMGFGGIWIWMIVVHAVLVGTTRRG